MLFAFLTWFRCDFKEVHQEVLALPDINGLEHPPDIIYKQSCFHPCKGREPCDGKGIERGRFCFGGSSDREGGGCPRSGNGRPSAVGGGSRTLERRRDRPGKSPEGNHGLSDSCRTRPVGRSAGHEDPFRFAGVARHHLCGDHPVGQGRRDGGLPGAVCLDELPQQPVRRGRDHQPGRPSVRPVGGSKVWRDIRSRAPGGDPPVPPGDHDRLRPDDPRLGQPHPLRSAGGDGNRGGGTGDRQAAPAENL